jgi:hypothetical protein
MASARKQIFKLDDRIASGVIGDPTKIACLRKPK